MGGRSSTMSPYTTHGGYVDPYRHGQQVGCINTGGYGHSPGYAAAGGYGNPVHNSVVSVPPPVNSAFCAPYMTHFIVAHKLLSLSSGKFNITDGQGRLLFEVESKHFGMHTKRILRDAQGVPLVLLKEKSVTLHDRWEAYRGDDSHERNLVFIMKKSSVYRLEPSFDIYLSANTALTMPDFTLKGDFYQHSYTIFYHHRPVAEASRNISFQSMFGAARDYYGVTVFPGVDQAFIASVVIIVDQVRQQDLSSGNRRAEVPL